jgi:hypothetical protein
MFHLTMFGASAVDMAPAGFFCVSLFGHTSVQRPTLARRVLFQRARAGREPSALQRLFGSDRNTVFTVFGATEILVPTLVQEYAALRRLVGSRSIGAEECRMHLDVLAQGGAERDLYTSLTLFGYCGVTRPSQNRERKALEAAVQNGTIEPRTREELAAMIGAPEPAVIDGLGRIALA